MNPEKKPNALKSEDPPLNCPISYQYFFDKNSGYISLCIKANTKDTEKPASSMLIILSLLSLFFFMIKKIKGGMVNRASVITGKIDEKEILSPSGVTGVSLKKAIEGIVMFVHLTNTKMEEMNSRIKKIL